MFKDIAQKYYLEQYLLPSTNISIKEVYNLLSADTFSIKQEIYPKQFRIRNLDLILRKKDSHYFYLKLYGFQFQILLNSIKVKFIVDDKNIIFDLFAEEQFRSLIKELKIQKPQIIYIINNNTFKTICNFTNYIRLYKGCQDIYIINIMEYKIMPKDILMSISERKQKNFLGKTFKSPIDFDKNFYFYFPNYKGQKDKFHVFYSEYRESVVKNILNKDSTVIKKYFGRNSIGKSITFIGTLKYMYDHGWYNTFYINCERIEYYSRKNYNICKQILIDEISYLFSRDYNSYCKAVNEIKNFNIIPNDKDKNFWSLLLRILNIIADSINNFYVIAFDQYNSGIDPFNQLNDFQDKVNKMDDFTIALMTVSSLNEKEIIAHKAKSLFNENELDYFVLYIEIDNFFDEESLKFEEKSIDKNLEYIGRNIKNFNDIASYINDGEDLEKKIKQKKNQIRNNIYNYYGIKEIIKFTPLDNIFNFLSFSVNCEYSIDEFEKIFKKIPLEYFDINQKINYVNNDYYFDLEYAYPMIEEIFSEIYSDIILCKTFNNILNSNILDGGSKGDLFEKMVIKNFTPGEYNNYSFNFFDEFMVQKIYSVPKFVPKENETISLNGDNKIKIEKKPFLLKQRMFGGKAFDIVIVKYFGESATFFCFQITGHKKKKDLMTIKQLKENIEKMILYMKNFFNFEIISIYFCYIFDHERIGENKIIKMCKNLDINNIKYIFYNKSNHMYFNQNNNILNNITQEMNEFKFINNNKIEDGQYKLNESQIKEIKKILKNLYNSEDVSFQLFGINALNIQNMINFNLFCIVEIKDFSNKNETFMFIQGEGEFKSIRLNKNGGSTLKDISALSIFNKTFDYYKIVHN